MGFGLVGAGGVAAVQAGLRQRLMERAHADQQAQEMELKKHQLGLDMRAADRADQGLAQNEAFRRDQLAAQEEQRAQVNAERELAGTQTLNNAIPAGRYPATPETTPIMGRLVKIGAATPVDATLGSTALGGMSTLPAPGAVTQGTLTKTEQPAQAAGFEKRASVSQQAAQDAADAKVEAARVATETRANENAQKELDRLANIKAAAASRAPATEHFTPLPQYDEKGNPTAPLAFSSSSGMARPIPGAGANHAAPGAAQAAQSEHAKHEALGSLDQLDQAIEGARAFIGPGRGQITSIQQMVGSQDPAVQALGTKMLLAKMQVDHAASGSVRAGASPAILARWDNIMSQKVTPEGLKASVQAMREILGGGAQTGGGKSGIKSITEIK